MGVAMKPVFVGILAGAFKGKAACGRFRRFQVKTQETIQP
jgi:hypothetical protein